MSDESPFFRLVNKTARAMAAAHCTDLPDGWTARFEPPRHSDAQRALMRSMAGDLAKQVNWCGQKMSNDDWVRFCTAKLKKDRIVFDCDDKGQVDQRSLISLGCSTRLKGKEFLNEMIAWFEWFGAQHGVEWSHEKAKVAQLSEMRR